jgi:hypothetical protein
VIIGNQISIVRDENTVPVRPFTNTCDPLWTKTRVQWILPPAESARRASGRKEN